jgi:hypothetical protein
MMSASSFGESSGRCRGSCRRRRRSSTLFTTCLRPLASNSLATDHVGRQSGMVAPRAGHLGHQRFGLIDQVALAQRFADLLAAGEPGRCWRCRRRRPADRPSLGQRFRARSAWSRPWSRRRWRPSGVPAWPAPSVSASSSSASSRPAQATRGVFAGAVGRGLGAVRGAEGVHHEDVAERGVLLGQIVLVVLLALVEAHVFQQHQLAVGDPSAACPDSRGSVAYRGRASRSAVGNRLRANSASGNSPSSGRPRCDMTITLAPALRQCSKVGIEAVMRASDVTWPF